VSETPPDDRVPDCLFCAIVAGDVPAGIVHSDDDVIAFRDINPQAPTHVLVVPRVHVADLDEAATDPKLSAALLAGIRSVAALQGLTEYRTVFNTGRQAGQTVFHVHAHVLGGRAMTWPPG
jgi:histidine triad (HIT) family protein